MAQVHDVLAENLRRYRAARGLSQDELNAALGTNRTYIGYLECSRRNITLTTLERLAEALGVDPLELLTAGGEVDTPVQPKVMKKARS